MHCALGIVHCALGIGHWVVFDCFGVGLDSKWKDFYPIDPSIDRSIDRSMDRSMDLWESMMKAQDVTWQGDVFLLFVDTVEKSKSMI